MDPKFIILNEDGSEDKRAMKRERIKETLVKAKNDVKDFMSSAWKFCKENKEELVVLVPLGLAAATGIKNLKSSTTRDSERHRIDHTYYDPCTGAHWQLKRQLSNRERSELMTRRRNGEFTEDILWDMGVLK